MNLSDEIHLGTQVTEALAKATGLSVDKLGKMVFNLPSQVIDKDCGWCDDPEHKQYNQLIKFPFSASAEKLHRDDDLYDLLFVINYNRCCIYYFWILVAWVFAV